MPTFEKYGYRATIPIVAGFVADKSNDPFWGSWAEWRDAANRGFEIANHSMYHRDSKGLHGSDFDVAIDQAKEVIEKNIGHKVTASVFPHDSYTDEAVSRALRSHEAIRTSEFLRPFYQRTVDIVIGGPHVSVETADRLVDIGIKRRLWLIAKCHGVTEKRSMRSFKSITPEFLESYLSYIHSKSDDVWVDTFSNVFEYMSRRLQTKIETKSFTENSIDFVLHNDKAQGKIIHSFNSGRKKYKRESRVKSASSADGHALRAYGLALRISCVLMLILMMPIFMFNGRVIKIINIKRLLLTVSFILVLSTIGFYVWLQSQYVVPILMYHSVSSADTKPLFVFARPFNVKLRLNIISPDSFEKQMGFLKNNGYQVIPLDEYVQGDRVGRKFPHKTVVITFDDGYVDNYTNAFPVLKKYHFPATVFLISDAVGMRCRCF